MLHKNSANGLMYGVWPSPSQVAEKEHITYVELEDLKNRPAQRFRLPKGYNVRGKVPDTCITVFGGEMMVNDCSDRLAGAS